MLTINISNELENSSKIEELKEFMERLKLSFSITKIKEKPYNKEFVDKILESKNQISEGKTTKMTIAELKDFFE